MNNELTVNIKNPKKLVLANQALLCIFIILSPIYKCLDFLTVMGFNIITVVSALLILTYILMLPNLLQTKQKRFLSFLIFTVFIVELYIQRSDINIGLMLTVFLFISFLQTDINIELEKLYMSFLISSIFAAIFSVFFGFTGGAITRVATIIDGSIAPISLAVALFVNPNELNIIQKKWDILKYLSIFSVFVVLIFGMSRARILIVGIMFGIYIISRIMRILKNGVFTSKGYLIVIITILVAIVLFLTVDFKTVFAPILARFEDGFESEGRDIETAFALNLFSNHKIFGVGWGDFFLTDTGGSIVTYNNHNWYVAILTRGGYLFAIPVFVTLLNFLFKSLRIIKISMFELIATVIVLALSYGNAGVFNYTISSVIPLIVINIKRR